MTNYIEFIQALKIVYPQIISAVEANAFDVDGNPVQYDMAQVQAYIDANAYKGLRQKEYPSIPDQLDTLYHSGLDAWKAQIKTVKDKYPKA